MNLEYINIIQESCEEMAAIFDYDNNYTLARPYLQEAEEQKEGLIKRGIGAIIRFAQKIYRWFKEKIEYAINTIRKKFFNNNKIVADQAEKMLMIEERKATGGSSSTAEPSSQASAPSQSKSEPASTPKAEPKQIAAPKQLSKERKAIFDTVRKIIVALRSDKPENIYNSGYLKYKNSFTNEEKLMDTYDIAFGSDDTEIVPKTAQNISDIEIRVVMALEDIDDIRKSSKNSKNIQDMLAIINLKGHLTKGGIKRVLENPIQKIKKDCFDVMGQTSSLLSEKERTLNYFKTNDLNKLSRMLDKELKKNKIHDKELLKDAHQLLLDAFKNKQIVFNKITSIFNVAAQQFTISTKKCIGLLFQLSRKS